MVGVGIWVRVRVGFRVRVRVGVGLGLVLGSEVGVDDKAHFKFLARIPYRAL